MDFQIVHMLFLQVAFWFLTLHAEVCFTLSTWWLFSYFFMGLQNVYTHTLRPGFRFSLAMHIFGLHSPSRCWIFIFSFIFKLNFSWGFHPLTLRPGFRSSLAMHVFGLHSPSRYWIFKVFLFSILIFHGVFILSLSDQVKGSHSPCAYLIDTLQAGIGF